MSGWKLGLDGFVTHFMVSGPQDRRRTGGADNFWT